MMKKKQVVRRMGGGAMKKQVVRRKGGGPMKKQVVKRMGGGPMKKQVVRRKSGGTMRPAQKVNSPGGQGGASLIGQHKRMAMGLMGAMPMVGSRKLKKMKKQTPNDRLDERLGMKDGKESTKSQSMKSRRDESRAMKRGGVAKKRGGGTMTPMAMRRGGGAKNTRRMNDLEELGRVDAERARTSKGKKNLTAEKNRIILELARKRKPSGRLNVDDIKRASQAANRRRKK